MSTTQRLKDRPKLSRTRMMLYQAMMNQLEKKSFSHISVNDICYDAMVSRTTFYVHFEDKYDLLRCCLLEMAAQLLDRLQGQEPKQFVHWILEYIAEHPKLFKNMLLNDINYELMRMLSELNRAESRVYLEYLQSEGERFQMPIDMLTIFISGGFSSLLLWWINSDFSVPVEDMTNYILSLWSPKA